MLKIDKNKFRNLLNFWIPLCGVCLLDIPTFSQNQKFFATKRNDIHNIQKSIISTAEYLMDEWEISYVYGGNKLENPALCKKCSLCLAKKKSMVSRKSRHFCPICSACSLDCTHFIQLVYRNAGLNMRYIDTRTMLKSSEKSLLKKFLLVTIADLQDSIPGDILVYTGHAVILERIEDGGYGDIIHVTAGKDIKQPGQGVQKERKVYLSRFRGHLKKILRHKFVHETVSKVKVSSSQQGAPPRLRKVIPNF